MAGLVPAIHVYVLANALKTWMPVTSTGMTSRKPRPPSLLLHRPALPAFHRLGLDAEHVEQAAAGVVDDVVDRLGPGVEGRHDRRHHGADVGERGHGAQMSAMQRRL